MPYTIQLPEAGTEFAHQVPWEPPTLAGAYSEPARIEREGNEVKSYYLEDFAVGQKYISAGRTVTESDISWFAGLSGDITPLSIDREAARLSEFGGRIAQGMLGSSILFGLWVRLGITNLHGIALLQTNWRYVLPIRPGDTIHAQCEVTAVKASSKGTPKGTVYITLNGINQLDEVVQEASMVYLIKARGMY